MDFKFEIKIKISKNWILVDSGAACSVFPRKFYPNATIDPSKSLKAINNSNISTFGTQRVKLKLGGHVFWHDVVIADVDGPVLGWDFIVHYKLDWCWSRDRQNNNKACHLLAPWSSRPIKLHLRPVSACDLDLAVVQHTPYKKWAQEHKITQSTANAPPP